MENFTPVASLLGGLLIGLAAALFMGFLGRVAGISGILGGLLDDLRGTVSGGFKSAGFKGDKFGDNWWRLTFLAGLVLGALIARGLAIAPIQITLTVSLPLLIGGGLLVGLGTSIGSGCTSGHGVCGLARFSLRSLVATLIFMGVAILTVTVVRHF